MFRERFDRVSKTHTKVLAISWDYTPSCTPQHRKYLRSHDYSALGELRQPHEDLMWGNKRQPHKIYILGGNMRHYLIPLQISLKS